MQLLAAIGGGFAVGESGLPPDPLQAAANMAIRLRVADFVKLLLLPLGLNMILSFGAQVLRMKQ